MPEIGIITEQGDLGLGFDLLNNKEQQTIVESDKRKQENDQQIIND